MQLASKEAPGAHGSSRFSIASLVPYARRMDGQGVGISVLE
jgi:hypothetical protein